ncbi:unnamed protein product [Pleuronectes platessa]|uniref:Uncharacterized protein n=1 Tax=Pleuronectes platessa TaxID=8262 RepID=A0A9N7TH28_PLEPL|nr:unnamed protein product [Pleuronectes platessa]
MFAHVSPSVSQSAISTGSDTAVADLPGLTQFLTASFSRCFAVFLRSRFASHFRFLLRSATHPPPINRLDSASHVIIRRHLLNNTPEHRNSVFVVMWRGDKGPSTNLKILSIPCSSRQPAQVSLGKMIAPEG